MTTGVIFCEAKNLSYLSFLCYNKTCAAIAQLVERIHGKDEVTGSNPVGGSIFFVL